MGERRTRMEKSLSYSSFSLSYSSFLCESLNEGSLLILKGFDLDSLRLRVTCLSISFRVSSEEEDKHFVLADAFPSLLLSPFSLPVCETTEKLPSPISHSFHRLPSSTRGVFLRLPLTKSGTFVLT